MRFDGSAPSAASLLRFQLECDGVQAISLACGRRPVGEDVSKVRIALGAKHLRANHAVAGVAVQRYPVFRNRRPVGWPAGAALKFCVGVEQLLPAADAGIDAFAFFVIVLSAPRTLRAVLAGDRKRFWR